MDGALKMKRQIDLKHAAALVFKDTGNEVVFSTSPEEKDNLKSLEIAICKTTTDGRLVPIPDDEPLILFRGRDNLALPLLKYYHELCRADSCNDFQLAQVQQLITKFRKFVEENPTTMKQPGATRGL